MNYPNGKPYHPEESLSQGKKKKEADHLLVAPGNRGMAFEADINATNEYYKEKGYCLITKRPTPINVVKVDYTHGPKITQAYFETQSTTDYNGVYDGHYIDFEAKSCRSKTSFPLSNIPPQQIDHLKRVISQKGIAFFLINMVLLKETYLLPAQDVIAFYESRPRASIPVDDLRRLGHLIPEGLNPRYDYLPVMISVFLDAK